MCAQVGESKGHGNGDIKVDCVASTERREERDILLGGVCGERKFIDTEMGVCGENDDGVVVF